MAFVFKIADASERTRNIECGSSSHFTVGFTDSKEIICTTIHITVNPNTTLHYTDARDQEFNVLEFYGCHIHIFPSEVFLQFEFLKKVKMIGNDLNDIPDHAFVKAIRLRELNLERNKLKKITKSTFKGATQLTYLNLEHNYIENISILAFDDMHLLEILYLAYNLITTIPIGLFASLENLKELYLYNNKIVSLHPKIFWHNKNLQIIDMEGNFLEKVNIQLNSNKLQILDLTNNDIIDLVIEGNSNSSGNIKKLLASNNKISMVKISVSCEIIDLNRNMISSFSNVSVASSLKTLNLAFNPIKVINSFIKELQHLDLSYTDLDLNTSTFFHFKFLNVLFLRGSKSNELPLKALIGLDNLQTLNIMDSGIKFIDYTKLVKILPSLTQLSVETDNFSCEFLQQFVEFLRKFNIYLIPNETFYSQIFKPHSTQLFFNNNGVNKNCTNSTVLSDTHIKYLLSDDTYTSFQMKPSMSTEKEIRKRYFHPFKILVTLVALMIIIIIGILCTGIYKFKIGDNYKKFRNVYQENIIKV